MKKLTLIPILVLILLTSVLAIPTQMADNQFGRNLYFIGNITQLCFTGGANCINSTTNFTQSAGFSNGSDITVRNLTITTDAYLNGSRVCTAVNNLCNTTTINNITNNITVIQNFTTINNLTNNITNNIYQTSATGTGVASRFTRWINTTHVNASSTFGDSLGFLRMGEQTAGATSGSKPTLEIATSTYSNNAELLKLSQLNGNDLSDLNMMFTRGSTFNASIGLTGNAQWFFQFKVMNTTSSLTEILAINRNGLSIGSYGVNPDGTSLIAAKNNVLRQSNLLKLTDSSGAIAFQVNDSQIIQTGSSAKMGFGITEPRSNSTIEITSGSAGVTRTQLRISSAAVNDESNPQMMFGRTTVDIATVGLVGNNYGSPGLADLSFKIANSTGHLNEQFQISRWGVTVGSRLTNPVTDTKFQVENDNLAMTNVFKLINSTGTTIFTVPNTGNINIATGQILSLGEVTAPPGGESLVVSKRSAGALVPMLRLENPSVNDLSDVALTFARANSYNATIETLGNAGMDLLIKTQNSTGGLNEIIMFKRDQTVGIGRFGVGAGPSALLHVKNSNYNKTTPFIVTGLADATLLSVDNDGDLYVARNVSATGYITRTDVYKSQTLALDSIKPATDYITVGGKIDHRAFDYSYVNYTREVFDEKTNSTITKYEEGVDLVKEVAMLKQALYEAKIRIEALEASNEVIVK